MIEQLIQILNEKDFADTFQPHPKEELIKRRAEFVKKYKPILEKFKELLKEETWPEILDSVSDDTGFGDEFRERVYNIGKEAGLDEEDLENVYDDEFDPFTDAVWRSFYTDALEEIKNAMRALDDEI